MAREQTPRIMTVYGTRPEAIKVAPLIRAFEQSPLVTSIAVTTGQHREMLRQVNHAFGITPDHDLDIMSHGQTLSEVFSRVLLGLDPLLLAERPDAVVVQGDTTTSTAAALAAFHRQIPVVHVEAGLRSGDLASPFPEEGNRSITGRISRLHLAPTATSRANLVREHIDPASILVTGNTVIDALLTVVSTPVTFADDRLAAAVVSDRPLLLVTTHRRENLGEPMRAIGRALARIAVEHPDLLVVLPIHRNPIVREAVLPAVDGLGNVLVVEPLDYPQFAHLIARCTLALTDSGGVQEEAPSLGKPVLVMRDTTERPEAVDAGTVRLIGTDENTLVTAVGELLRSPAAYAAMAHAVNPYGDGRAAERSLAAIARLLGVGTAQDQHVNEFVAVSAH